MAEPKFKDYPGGEGLAAPKQGEAWSQWLLQLGVWKKIKLMDPEVAGDEKSMQKVYASEAVKRSSATYVTVQTMVHDRFLYDPDKRVWTAKKYLDDLTERYGGIDQILLWSGYPNLGVDSRSQFDLIESLPGGPEAAVRALKAAQPSLMVHWPYKPWDIATNGLGQNDTAQLVELVARTGADGVNFDTMSSKFDLKGNFNPMTRFFEAATNAGVADLIIEPENDLFRNLPYLNVSTQGWLYTLQTCYSCKTNVPFAPAVSAQKWLARRSMPHVTGRWASQRSEEILTAFFNGIGYNSWENIWGIWNGFNDRDGELLRRSAAVLRYFHEMLADPEVQWLPHYPIKSSTPAGGHVFASKFVGKEKELWLLINTANENATVDDWALPFPSSKSSRQSYDMYHGVKLLPSKSNECLLQSCELVRVPVEARGIGVVLRTERLSPRDAAMFEDFPKLTSRALASFSNEWGPVAMQKLVEKDPESSQTKVAAVTTGMVRVPGSPSYEFHARGIEIEGFLNDRGQMDDWVGVDVQYPWEQVPTKYHQPHVLAISDLWVDKLPVTNEEFSKFLSDASYVPKDPQNFLRHWGGEGCGSAKTCAMPAKLAKQPVVFVGLDDARAFCAHGGKRLPREWEWQHAAQGGDPSRRYPWGSEWRPDLMPTPQNNAAALRGIDVGQFPKSASKHGIEDLVGLVWQWTDEYEDDHTRGAVLKGGSAFQPQRWQETRYQPWYFPGLDGNWTLGDPWKPPYSVSRKDYSRLYNLTAHGKYLLMAPSLDRAGTIGFRCVMEASP
eukprot:TRINITY_DN16002_c0_g1_i1.p1 TRINITY_DN16002_c0_g1~~TRINITY_DN16002_c0_g1_i1.p1  ORF type:complete len:901 (+),score=150.73 TRINITY_DN16002_c0_g1_i1:357-2705(+)